MPEKRYIHIRNWDLFQHPDTTRAKQSAIPWIKSYTGQLADEDYVDLSWADRGLLEALRLQYATTRGRGINDSTTNLQRLFGQRVLRVQLERLNDAGFITFSASKTLAPCKQPASPEVEREEEREREEEKELTQGLTALHNAGQAKAPDHNLQTPGETHANPNPRRVRTPPEDANGSEPTPSESHGPLRDAVRNELARTQKLRVP